MTTLSIIIPAYNDLPGVMSLIAAIRNTATLHAEVIVQDDCSPNVDFAALMPNLAQRNAQNLGFPGNCNAGATRAHGDVLLFLNQDVYMRQLGWDVRLLDWFRTTPQLGIAGPTLLFPDGRVQSVGGEFDAKSQPYHVALGARNADWSEIATPRRVGWVTGAALAIRRDLWQQLGGFDTVYGRGYFEDVDLCLRAQQLGAEAWHLPAVRLYHRVGSTGGNPQFRQNAQTFKARWVDTNIIEPSGHYVRERFW